ncbi:MAG: cation:proton antiporter [Alphaproteobacteria bacterium]|nr:cation:proton antiporter [Alphaproteobacteria bacterium]
MDVLGEMLVLLVLTRLLGEAAERVGQSASVGELIAGIVLAGLAGAYGDTLPFLAHIATSEALEYAASLGIFFLMLLAGIEMEPREISRGSMGSFMVAAGGVILPMTGGIGLAWWFLPESELKQVQTLLVGVALSITAVPVTVKVFTELGMLHTRVGRMVVSAAIFDDVLGLFVLAILTAMIETGSIPDIATLALMLSKVVAFFAIAVALGVHVYPRFSRRLKAMQAAAFEFSALIGVALAYGLLAELLGIHWVLGVFMAGLYFEPARVGRRAYLEIKLIVAAVTGGFLGPLFFASIGLGVDLRAAVTVPGFLALLIAIAVGAKMIGSGLPALWAGMSRRDAAAVGTGMVARGATELVVISIAAEAGLFATGDSSDPVTANLYSALVLMAVVTTLITPILLRLILPAAKDR